MDWVTDSLNFCLYLIAVLVYGSLLYLFACDLAACFRRWRIHRHSRGAAERLLDSVPDVPYLPLLPDDQQGASPPPSSSSSSSSCVICLVEYARGEGRFIMPVCGHAFHRACIAEWLRQGNTTCPICRAIAVVVVVPPLAAGEEDFGVSTAEDMV